jgi:hypothetical protein
VGDVGDVDLEVPMAGGVVVLDENGVVEVTRGLAIDGDDGQVAEVAAVSDDFGVEMSDSAGFGENLVGKNAREMVLADHHLDVDAEVVGMAENFDDFPAGGASGRRPRGDFNVDDETFEIARIVVADLETSFFAENAMRSGSDVRRGEFGVVRNDDGLGHPVVEGGDVVAAEVFAAAAFACVVKDADDGGIAAGEDPEDAAEASAVGPWRSEFNEDLVALHGVADFVGGDKDVVFTPALGGADEAKAVAVEVEASGDEVFGAVAGGAVGS